MTARESYSQCAAGLTYWVYETTLVYLIFKAWAPHKYVVWDWEGPPNAISGRKNPVDLILTVEPGQEFGIEAKWWNTQRAELAMDTDANKLLNWIERAPQRRGFLMAFWWTDFGSLATDQDDARAWRDPQASFTRLSSVVSNIWTSGQGGRRFSGRQWSSAKGQRGSGE